MADAQWEFINPTTQPQTTQPNSGWEFVNGPQMSPANWGEVDKPQEPPGMLASLGRGVAQGATFGFADELAGAVNTVNPFNPVGDGSYVAGRDFARARDVQARQAHPYAYGTGDIAGSVAPAAIATVASGGALGPSAGASLGGRLAAGMYAGAASGAARGAGDAPEMQDVPGSAMAGGLLGAGAGMAGPMVQGAGKVASAVENSTTGPLFERAGNAIRNNILPPSGPIGYMADKLGPKNIGRAAASLPGVGYLEGVPFSSVAPKMAATDAAMDWSGKLMQGAGRRMTPWVSSGAGSLVTDSQIPNGNGQWPEKVQERSPDGNDQSSAIDQFNAYNTSNPFVFSPGSN